MFFSFFKLLGFFIDSKPLFQCTRKGNYRLLGKWVAHIRRLKLLPECFCKPYLHPAHSINLPLLISHRFFTAYFRIN